jgi:sugar lactone lactonase YvrE
MSASNFTRVECGPPVALLPAQAAPMQVGECPLWHPQQQALYWVDIPARTVHRHDPANGIHQSWLMPSDAAALAWVAEGVIVALRSAFVHLNSSSGHISKIADVPYNQSKIRCNDGKVDALGRFWVGTLYEPRDLQAAEMLCLAQGRVRQVWQGGMTVSNGLAFARDGLSLWHADTTSHQIRRHALDLDAATVGSAQLVHQFSSVKDDSYGGRPDGAAFDSEGAYWSAMFEGGRLLRIAPDGSILQEVTLPVRCPTMPAFGGADFKTLYITSASQNRSAAELAQYPLSGQVLCMRVSVAGLAEPAYRA